VTVAIDVGLGGVDLGLCCVVGSESESVHGDYGEPLAVWVNAVVSVLFWCFAGRRAVMVSHSGGEWCSLLARVPHFSSRRLQLHRIISDAALNSPRHCARN
jgi:hypothetical protein